MDFTESWIRTPLMMGHHTSAWTTLGPSRQTIIELAMAPEFYNRPMVSRIREIFGNPPHPDTFQQDQFDGAQDRLERTAAKLWHEVDRSDYWHYLLDLCYVELDQKLFDHLFPAFLIKWWEGLLDRTGGPASECDFYRAVDHGRIFEKMMDGNRRQQVFRWMTDGFVQGVDAWSGQLSATYNSDGPDNLQGPLSSFNAIGQAIPILGDVLDEVRRVKTTGRAQFWLVLATGLLWNENESPFVPPWTPDKGGGGVYVFSCDASIFDHGYLPQNLDSLAGLLDTMFLEHQIITSLPFLEQAGLALWGRAALDHLRADRGRAARRIERFIYLLGRPNLGGVRRNALDGKGR